MQNNAYNQLTEVLEKIDKDVFNDLFNAEKNTYDPEIRLPKSEPHDKENIKNLLDTRYRNVLSANSINEDRRKKRLNTLGRYIKNENYDAAKNIVKASYYISLDALFKKIEEKTGQCTRTANKRIKNIFKMIGYEIKHIPKNLVDEIIELYKQSDNYKTLINICEDETPADIWTMIKNEQTIKNIYNTYLIAKQIILIESNNKKDYDEKISSLRYDKRLKAIYAAAKELI